MRPSVEDSNSFCLTKAVEVLINHQYFQHTLFPKPQGATGKWKTEWQLEWALKDKKQIKDRKLGGNKRGRLQKGVFEKAESIQLLLSSKRASPVESNLL